MLRINNNETVNIKYLTSDMSNNKQRYAISLAAEALDKYYNSKSYGDMA